MQLPNTQASWPPPAQPRERRRFGSIAALFLSFGSPGLYRDVARRWRGIGFWYLVLLMLLTSIPEAIKAHIGFSTFARSEAPAALEGFPHITIQKGQASIEEPEPYLWREKNGGQVLLYVDTTGAFDLPAGKNALAKLSKSKLEIRKNEYETQTMDLSSIGYFHLDKARLLGWIDVSSHWIGPGVFAIMIIFGTIGHLIQILIYGVLGLLFCAMCGASLRYASLMRLAAVAITPALILGTALSLAGKSFSYEGFVYFAIEMFFLFIAVAVNKTDGTGSGYSATPYQPQVPYGATPGGYPQPPGGYAPPYPSPPPPPQPPFNR